MATKTSETRYPRLSRSILRKLNRDDLREVVRNGAGAGFGGFTYYSDTCKFFRDNKKDILALAEDMARELGEDTLSMIAGFVCLRDNKITPYEVAQGLEGRGDAAHLVQNAMAWFALEEVSREIVGE